MKGDFSRIRFNPKQQYTAVVQQQGRVSLDADANEQAAIDGYLGCNQTVDVIGPFGAPAHDPGFQISVSQNEILIGAGRYYVQGLVCENLNDGLPYLAQPRLLNAFPTDATLLSELAQAGASSAIRLYLQVWQRLVTALDDPCLREPALGQADTTARLQTVWRVVGSLVPPPQRSSQPASRNFASIFGGTLLQARQNLAEILRLGTATELAGTSASTGAASSRASTAAVAAVDCCAEMYANTPVVSTGAMSASTLPGGSDCGCQPIASAGYQGLENQLYRVEIHQGGNETSATFKWSRENASVVTSIQGVHGNTVVVDSLGPDINLGFVAGQWVEISDDANLFGEIPNASGTLYQIQSVDPAIPSITLNAPVGGIDPSRNARLRRWDQTGASITSAGVPLDIGSGIPLENGIQVTFRAGSYQPGDYWLIPARTASGLIDWPPCGSNGDLFQPPQSITVYNAPLACIHWDPQMQQPTVEDCRRFFTPLTEISSPAASKALHVSRINWVNDALMTADAWVANGLAVTLDAAPTSPITSAEFIVTLESIFDPFPATGLYYYNPTAPSTFLRTVFTIDSTITVSGATIAWTLPYVQAPQLQMLTVNAINTGMIFGASFGQYARVRVRLLGNTISSGTGGSQLFLDGQALGRPLTDANGITRIDLQLPSGKGEASSNFESWFYLAPTLLIANLSVAYPALYVTALGSQALTVSATPTNPTTGVTGPPVSPFVTARANYRALADTPVTLSLVDGNGVPSTYATVESPVTLHKGELSVNAAITIIGDPLTDDQAITVTLTVQASIATALGPITAVPVTFSLTGLFVIE